MVVSTATLAGIMSLLAELDADRDIKTKEEIQEECFGDVYTREEFLEQVRSGCINCFDGIGYYHDGNEKNRNQCMDIRRSICGNPGVSIHMLV